MFKSLICFCGMIIFATAIHAQQTCFDSLPTEVKATCEIVNDNVYFHLELLDVVKAALTKADIYMGNRLFDNDNAMLACQSQLNRFTSSGAGAVVDKPRMIALCENVEPTLLRIVLRPQQPYITVVDKKRMNGLDACFKEMNEINSRH